MGFTAISAFYFIWGCYAESVVMFPPAFEANSGLDAVSCHMAEATAVEALRNVNLNVPFRDVASEVDESAVFLQFDNVAFFMDQDANSLCRFSLRSNGNAFRVGVSDAHIMKKIAYN